MIIYLRLSDSLAKFLSLDGKLELQEVHPKGCPPPDQKVQNISMQVEKGKHFEVI